MTREDLAGPGLLLLNRGGVANPDVLLVATPRGRIVVKDYAPRSWPVRRWLAPVLVRHEVAMLRRVAGLPGAPGWVSRVDGMALAMEYLEGRSLRRRWYAGRIPETFFDALDGILEGFANRGVAHLDLRSPTNLLVTPTGAPAVVDLGGAVAGPLPVSWRRWLERRALAKLRRRLGEPGPVEPEAPEGEGGPVLELDVDVLGLRWRRYEAGELRDPVPAVLIPDFGTSGRIFEGALRAAGARGRRAIALDLPGDGGSARERRRRGPGRTARRLAALLGILRLERVDLVGLGFGELVARRLARDRPDAVRMLLALDAPTEGTDSLWDRLG